MQVLTLEEFLSNPWEFAGDAQNIVIASYNQVEGYSNGTTLSTKDGRTVKVIAGGGMFVGVNFGTFLVPNANPELVQTTKDIGVVAVSCELLSVASNSTFIVLYAGTSRLDEMITLGIRLAEKGVRVALLSCGCDGPENFYAVNRSSVRDTMLLIVPRPEFCDSEYADLGRITRKFLE